MVLRSCRHWTKEILILFENNYPSKNDVRCRCTIQSFSMLLDKNAAISSLDDFKYVVMSNNCLYTLWLRRIYLCLLGYDFYPCHQTTFFSAQTGLKIIFNLFSTISLIPSLSCQQNSSTSLYVSFATKWLLRLNCLFKQKLAGYFLKNTFCFVISFWNHQIFWR